MLVLVIRFLLPLLSWTDSDCGNELGQSRGQEASTVSTHILLTKTALNILKFQTPLSELFLSW